MKSVLNGTMLLVLVLGIVSGIVSLGAVDLEFAAPLLMLSGVLVLLWAAKLLLVRQVSRLQTPAHGLVIAFLAYATIRYITSPIEYESRLELFHVAIYALIWFLVTANFRRTRDRTVMTLVLMGVAVAESGYGFWQFIAEKDVVLSFARPEQYHGRASGTYICPNHFAGFLEVVLALVVARLAMHQSDGRSLEHGLVRKLIEGYVALVVVVGLIVSLSRGAWVATSVSLIAFLFFAWRAEALRARVLITALGILFLAGGVGLSVPAVRQRVAQTINFKAGPAQSAMQDITLAGRTMMWRATVALIRDHPVVGTGPNTWQWVHLKVRDPRLQCRPRYAHSDVLHVVSDYGGVGVVMVAAMLGCFFWHATRLARPTHALEKRVFALGSMTAVTAILVHSLVDFNMHIPANALLVITLMGLTVAMDDEGKCVSRVEMKGIPKILLGVTLLIVLAAGTWVGTRMVRAHQYTVLGTASKETLSWEAALRFYGKAVAYDPKYPEPYARMGDIYRTQAALRKDPAQLTDRLVLAQKAIDAYQHSINLNPFQSEIMLRLAAACELLGDDKGALNAYQQALLVDPNNAFNYMRLGIFYRHMGEDERAAEAFEISAKLNVGEGIALVNLEDIRRRKSP